MTKFSEMAELTIVDPVDKLCVVDSSADALCNMTMSTFLDNMVGHLQLTGGKVVGRNETIESNGDADLYEVPSGYKLMVCSASIYNTTFSTYSGFSFFWQAYIDGAYRPLTTQTSSLPNTGTNNFTTAIVLEAGEKFGYNVAYNGPHALSNISVRLYGILMRESVPAYSPRLVEFTSSNALYTAPAGKTACYITGSLLYGTMQFTVVNYSASAVLAGSTYLVRNGGSPSIYNRTSYGTITSSSYTATTLNLGVGFASGDSLYFEPSLTHPAYTGLFAWTNVFESENA